jgi:RHS repeat-associated protein
LYNPFGTLIGKWGSCADENNYRFSSKEYDPSTGFYYYGYRFYDPELQRWLNRDPIEEAGGLNLYTFLGNTPVNMVDPLGLDGNPVSSTLHGVPGTWASDAYGSGEGVYQPGAAYVPGSDLPLSPEYPYPYPTSPPLPEHYWNPQTGMWINLPGAQFDDGILFWLSGGAVEKCWWKAAEKVPSLASQLEDLGGGVPSLVPTSKGAAQFRFPNGTVLRFDLQPGQFLEGQGPHINLQFVPGWPNQNIHIPLAK